MWRFKNEFKDAQIVIAAHGIVITSKNLTDERAEMIVKKFPQYAHNLEQVADGGDGEATGGEKLVPGETDRLTGKPKGEGIIVGQPLGDNPSPEVLKAAEIAEAKLNKPDAVKEIEEASEEDETLAALEKEFEEENDELKDDGTNYDERQVEKKDEESEGPVVAIKEESGKNKPDAGETTKQAGKKSKK
jgi:hypothetical protein